MMGKMRAALRAGGPRHAARYALAALRYRLLLRRMGRMPALSAARRKAEAGTAFGPGLTISLLVPLYHTPLPYLRALVDSVRAQTFAGWQLCLADGSEDGNPEREAFCQRYAAQDERILYQALGENRGISGNTNAALDMATGSHIGLLDHDDFLHPSALFEAASAIRDQGADFLYTDEAVYDDAGKRLVRFNLKGDFAPDTLRSYNYICHLSVFSRHLLQEVGPLDPATDGSQDFDLFLRLSEKARRIVHIPRVLYYWRQHAGSTAAAHSAKPYVGEAAKRALTAHLRRMDLRGAVQDGLCSTTYRIAYNIEPGVKISILIPNKDQVPVLRRCVDSILALSTYPDYEILVIENNSTEAETFAYYEAIEKNPRVRVLRYPGAFNFSALNNFAAAQATGQYLLLLNNDTQVITPGWMEEMLMFAQRPDVGAVGAKLLYPDGRVQHAGVIVGIRGMAGHGFRFAAGDTPGYMMRLMVAQNLSAVTAACLLVRRTVYEEMGGLDERFRVAMNDVDFCLRLRRAGYLNVFTPFAVLTHHESLSRGYEDTPEKKARFTAEVRLFQEEWAEVLAAGDPYYNPGLTLEDTDFRLAGRESRCPNKGAKSACRREETISEPALPKCRKL